MAFNNHFFFEALSPEPTAMPEALQADLEQSFGSIETLRHEFVVTASSMFGPGFVWLMKNRAGKYTILCTYLAGSPFPGKKAFAESWWHTIDWSKVEERAKPAQGRKPSLL